MGEEVIKYDKNVQKEELANIIYKVVDEAVVDDK